MTMNAFRKSVAIRGFAWLGILLGTVWWPASSWANPTGGQVILGNANISAQGTGNLLIDQLSNRALIQWDSFSIAQGELTRFAQPGANSVALNRVVGASPSMLNGLLQANGNVFLVNSNGVFVGSSGVVDVGGFMASTLDMSNADFERGGSFTLSGGSVAPVANMGTIRAANGDVYLVAHEVHNSGTIGAMNGTVALAGGNEVLVNPGGAHGEKVFVSAGNGSVSNDGQITSGFAELKAHGNVHALAVQNSGSIRATGAELVGGRVVLRAGDGDISSTGTIEAVGSGVVPGSIAMETGAGEVRIGGLLKARSETGNGGSISLTGNTVNVDGGGMIDAGGDLNGGRIDVAAGEIVLYGNSTLSANGTTGGDVRLQATGGVLMAGRVSAEGTTAAGGSVVATGERVLVQNDAEVNASGATGGKIRVGGGVSGQDASIANAQAVIVDQGARLAANGTAGNGGSVVVYANAATRFDGQIDARATGIIGNGGFAEVSGKLDLTIGGKVNTSAVAGKTGTFLIDPADVTIGTGGTITGSTLSNLLQSNNVIVYTDPGQAGLGDITVIDPVQWASDNSLAMLASNNINVRNHVRNAGGDWDTLDTVSNNLAAKDGTGNIYLVAGWDGVTGKLGTDGPGNVAGVIGDGGAGDVDPGVASMSDATYFTPNFGAGQVGLTYAVGGVGTISLEAGYQGQAGVVVGSRYGTTGLAANSVQLIGNPSNNGFAMIGFRDNGRIGDFVTDVITRNADGSATGSLTAPAPDLAVDMDDNYWWYSINPNSALPGQGLALNAVGTGGLGLNTQSDRSINTSIITGTQAQDFVVNQGGLVGEAASLVQPEWVPFQAYDAANDSANASAIRGDIVVNSAGAVELRAGNNGSFVQIGHVGGNASANLMTVNNLTANRNGTIGSGALPYFADANDDGIPDLTGSRSGAAEVDGAHVFGADINVQAGLDPLTKGYVMLYANPANTNAFGYSMIGHGGSRTSGVREGDISVQSEGGVFLYGGRGTESFASIGHTTSGILHTARSQQYRGDILVDTPELVFLRAYKFPLTTFDNPNRSFVQIGHGGRIEASNDLGRNRNMMLGSNVLEGSITVNGDRGVTMNAGNRTWEYAQIGHNASGWGSEALSGQGGSERGNGTSLVWHLDSVTGSISGYDPASAPSTALLAGSTKVYNGVNGIQVTSSDGSILVAAGTEGRVGNTSATGNPIVFAYSMIGSGGQDGRFDLSAGGDISVTAHDDIRVLGGAHLGNFAQIGNGGDSSRAARNLLDEDALVGNINVIAQTGSVIVQGGDAYAYKYLSGATTNFLGVRERMYAMIGNGGYNGHYGLMQGDILVKAAKDVTLKGGAGDFSWASIGNGGAFAHDGATLYDPLSNTGAGGAGNWFGTNRGFNGAISVIAGQDVNVLGGPEIAKDAGVDPGNRGTWRFGRDNTNGTELFLNYAQIGHGGAGTSAITGITGDSNIEVAGGRDVRAQGGEGMLSYAQLGHGGPTSVNLDFDMDLDKIGNTSFPTGADGNGADALDVGYLFLIRPSSLITSGPDGLLGKIPLGNNTFISDDGINDGYAETTNGNVRVYALYPGAAGNVSIPFDGATPISTLVANWNASHSFDQQVGFIGPAAFAPQGNGQPSGSLNLSGGINNRFGPDGIPFSGDEVTRSVTASTALRNADYDDSEMQSRRYAQDDHFGDITVTAVRDVYLQGGDRTNVNTNISESFAYSQIGHGGPGNLGSSEGNIRVTVGRDLYANGNFSGSGQMDPSKFLDRGTLNTSAVGLTLQTASGAGSSRTFTFRSDGGTSLQTWIDLQNAGLPNGGVITVGGNNTNQNSVEVRVSSITNLVVGMKVTDPNNANSAINGRTVAYIDRDNPIRDSNGLIVGYNILLNGNAGVTLANAALQFEHPDRVIVGGVLTAASAGNIVFKPGVSLNVSGGVAWAPASVTLTSVQGNQTLSATITAKIPGTGGNSIRFSIKSSEVIAEAVARWNADPANKYNQVVATGDTQIMLQNQGLTQFVQLAGGRDGTVASASQNLGWLSSTAATTMTTIGGQTIGTTIGTFNSNNVNRIGFLSADLAGTFRVEDLVLNSALALTGGTASYINWNQQNTTLASQQIPRTAPTFLFGSAAPLSLGISTVKGDAYAKIGHGEDVRNLIREPGMFQNSPYAYVAQKGNIEVSIGNNGNFSSALVGHANSNPGGSTYTPFDSGSTYIAVSRLNPLGTGTGVLTAAGQGAFNTVFASGRDGTKSQLRLYSPLTNDFNFVGGNTRLNGEVFVYPLFRGRADTYEEPENSMVFSNRNSSNFPTQALPVGSPEMTFGAAPLGSYVAPHGIGGIGKYTFYISPKYTVPAGVFVEIPSPDSAYDLGTGEFDDQIDLYGRVDERPSLNRTFSFQNYRSNESEWRTDRFHVGFLGGLGGGNAMVLDENGQLVPMPVNLDPNAGKTEVSSEEATAAPGATLPPALPNEDANKQKKEANAFGTSTEGSGVQTQAPPAASADGGMGDMGNSNAPAEAPAPAAAPEQPAPAAPKAE